MLVTLKEHALLREYFSSAPDTQYHATLLHDNSERLNDYLSWSTSPVTGRQEYYQKLVEGPCYYLYPLHRKDRGGMDTFMPVPAALLNVVDLDQHGTRLRLISSLPYARNLLFGSPMTVGQEFWGTPTHSSYEDAGWKVLDGLMGEYSVPDHCCAPWDEAWVNPFSLVIGKVVAPDNGVLPTSSLGYYLPLVRNSTANTCALQHGEYKGVNVPSSCFAFAETDKDRELFARKAHAPFRLLVSSEVANMLAGVNQQISNYFAYFTGDYWESQNMFLLGQAAPDYLAVDPADYKRVTFVPHAKVAGLLLQAKDPWTDGSRQSTTWGKLAKMLLNQAHCRDETKYEDFSAKLVATATDLYGPEDSKPELLIVRGMDIATAYNKGEVTGVGANSSGCKSCMNSKPDSYFAVYTQNPEQVAMLICRDRLDGTLHGRALLWTDVHGNTFLDRRYVLNPVAEARMVKYATGLGYVDIWTGLSKAQPIKVDVQLANPYHLHYPWIDSLRLFHPGDGTLHNQHKSGTVNVQSTGGVRSAGHNEVHCAQSQVLAPRTKLEQTASGDYAFAQYVLTLRSGKKELEKRCVEDQLEGGLISKAEAVSVGDNYGMKLTSRGNPGIAILASTGGIHLKECLVMSPLDGGFIGREIAVQQPDGGWCLPQTVARYQAMRSRKKVNQALRTPASVPVAQLINAAAELSVAA